MNIVSMLDLSNKVAVVTGSSRGLGFAYAEALARAGANIVVTCISGNLSKIVNKISSYNKNVLAIKADITSKEQVKELVKKTVKKFGKIDILVNNAATDRINISPEKISLDDWNFVINTNITGTFICSKEVAKIMIKRKKGKIINISSISGFIINKYFHGGSYDVSKSAIIQLTKALAVEWAKYNINVNAIAPGYYNTEPNKKWFNKNKNIYRKVIDMIPLKRFGNIDELSAFLVCMASDITNYMTGTTILIDGGYTIW